jgi:MFS superfamily sulfate permease-like transporter
MIPKHTLTIFNKYTEITTPPFTEAWNRTVIKYGQWEDDVVREFANSIINTAKQVNIIIRANADTEGKEFLDEIEWNKLPADQKVKYWTLRMDDYVFFGEVPELTTIASAKKDFKHCLINGVVHDMDHIPHWEVTGV